MREIRIGWLIGLHETDDGTPTNGGNWLADTPKNRTDLAVIIEAGCDAAGPESHWLEERVSGVTHPTKQ